MRKKPSTPPPGGTPPDDPTALELEEAAPVTPSRGLLSTNHQRFCREYLFDLDAQAAYHRAYGASPGTCASEGYRLLKLPAIRAEVQRLLDERAHVTGITADRVLLKLWEEANADPRELVEVRVGACRHCHGLYHQYQFTFAEYERAEQAHVHAENERRKQHAKKGGAGTFEPRPFHDKGGSGYSPNRPPHPDCPECHGDGIPRTIIKDQSKASPGALAMFGGVKYDKDGRMQVLVHSRLPALKLVAEHLGMFNASRVPATADPLQDLLEEIHGAHGAGTALAIVHDDPEARPARDVQDVVAKEPKQEPGSYPTPAGNIQKQEPGSYPRPSPAPSQPRPKWRPSQ